VIRNQNNQRLKPGFACFGVNGEVGNEGAFVLAWFWWQDAAMLDPDSLKPASSDELAESLSHALLYDRRRRVHDADRLIARVAAVRLVEHFA
jgi:hypothetical protein